MYVLSNISVTAPTFHLERSPLKAAALENTAPPEQRSPHSSATFKRDRKKRGKKK